MNNAEHTITTVAPETPQHQTCREHALGVAIDLVDQVINSSDTEPGTDLRELTAFKRVQARIGLRLFLEKLHEGPGSAITPLSVGVINLRKMAAEELYAELGGSNK